MTRPALVRVVQPAFLVVSVFLLYALGVQQWVATFRGLHLHQELVADFAAYHHAGTWVRAGGSWDLYSDSIFDPAFETPAAGPFANPPFAAILMWPMSFLPLRSAFFVSIALNCLGWIGICWALFRRIRFRTNAERLLAVCWLASYPAAISVVALGTFGMVITGLFLAMAFREPDGDSLVVGLLAAGLLIKPQYVVIPAVVLLVHRRWRSMLVLAVGGAVWFVGGALVGGVSVYSQYLAFSSRFAENLDRRFSAPATDWVPKSMPVIRGLLVSVLGAEQAAVINNWSVVALAVGMVAIAVIARKMHGPQLWAITLFVTIATSFHTNPGDTVLLVVALVAWWNSIDSKSPKGARVLFVSFCLVWPLALSTSFWLPLTGVLIVLGLAFSSMASLRRTSTGGDISKKVNPSQITHGIQVSLE